MNFKNTFKGATNYTKKVVGAEHIQEQHTWIKGMAQAMLSPAQAIAQSRVESFNQAKHRLGLTESDLIKSYKTFTITFYVCVILACLCLCLAGYYFVVPKVYITGTATVSIALICVTNAFRYAFRAFQIKHRSLISVSEFIKHGKAMIPKY